MHVLSQQAQGVRSVHAGMQFSLHEFGYEFIRIFHDFVLSVQTVQYNMEVQNRCPRHFVTELHRASLLCVKNPDDT